MNWWDNALYDTCSLITLDKIRLDHPEILAYFKRIQAIEPSLSSDHLYGETTKRLIPFLEIIPMPPPHILAVIIQKNALSRKLANVDVMVFATAVHYQYPVITGDSNLAKAVKKIKQPVGNIALILKELLQNKLISEPLCQSILDDLAKRNDYILSIDDITCNALKKYQFP